MLVPCYPGGCEKLQCQAPGHLSRWDGQWPNLCARERSAQRIVELRIKKRRAANHAAHLGQMEARFLKAEAFRQILHNTGELADGIAQSRAGHFIAGIRRGTDDRENSREQIVGVGAGALLYSNPAGDAQLPEDLLAEGGIRSAALVFAKCGDKRSAPNVVSAALVAKQGTETPPARRMSPFGDRPMAAEPVPAMSTMAGPSGMAASASSRSVQILMTVPGNATASAARI